MRTLIIYYSFEGHTERVADILAQKLNAERLRITPQKEITTHGFMKYVWGGKQATMKKAPELMPYTFRADKYETIIIGTPVWAFTMTPPVRSFLQKEKISKKRIALFCTHRGVPGRTLQHMQHMVPDNTVVGTTDFFMLSKQETTIREKACRWAETLLCKEDGTRHT